MKAESGTWREAGHRSRSERGGGHQRAWTERRMSSFATSGVPAATAEMRSNALEIPARRCLANLARFAEGVVGTGPGRTARADTASASEGVTP